MVTTMVQIDKNGRLVLPVAVRRALGVERGGDVVLTLEDGGDLRLVSRQGALARVQALVGTRAQGRMLSEELSAERRADAARE